MQMEDFNGLSDECLTGRFRLRLQKLEGEGRNISARTNPTKGTKDMGWDMW